MRSCSFSAFTAFTDDRTAAGLFFARVEFVGSHFLLRVPFEKVKFAIILSIPEIKLPLEVGILVIKFIK